MENSCQNIMEIHGIIKGLAINYNVINGDKRYAPNALDVIAYRKRNVRDCKEPKVDDKYHTSLRVPLHMLTIYPSDRISIYGGITRESEDTLQKPIDPEELLKRGERDE